MNHGLYHAKNVKLYGKKIIGVTKIGSFVLGEWEQLNTQTSFNGAHLDGCCCEINGTYIAFAFSFDVTWGTDFPFSGVFWNNINDTPAGIKLIPLWMVMSDILILKS